MKRKQLIFDLDTKVCNQILGRNYRQIYDDIRKYLEKYDFIHIQGTGYESKYPLSYQVIDT